MKHHTPLVATAITVLLCASSTLMAEATLPAASEKERWHEFINTFAECSAVYNLAATLRETPVKGSTTYRELANNALISGMMSAEKVGLDSDYLESIYSVKMALWQPATKDEEKQPNLFKRADYCVIEVLPYQEAIIATLRNHSAKN